MLRASASASCARIFRQNTESATKRKEYMPGGKKKCLRRGIMRRHGKSWPRTLRIYASKRKVVRAQEQAVCCCATELLLPERRTFIVSTARYCTRRLCTCRERSFALSLNIKIYSRLIHFIQFTFSLFYCVCRKKLRTCKNFGYVQCAHLTDI